MSRRKSGMSMLLLLVSSTMLYAGEESGLRFVIDANGARPRMFRISAKVLNQADEFKPRILKKSVIHPKGTVFDALYDFQLGKADDGRWVLVYNDSGSDGSTNYVKIGEADDLDRITLDDNIEIHGYYSKDETSPLAYGIPGRNLSLISYQGGYEPPRFTGELVSSRDLVERWLSAFARGGETKTNIEILDSVFTGCWEYVMEFGTFCSPECDGNSVNFREDPSIKFKEVFVDPVSRALESLDGEAGKALRKRVKRIVASAKDFLGKIKKRNKKAPWEVGSINVHAMERILDELTSLSR